MRVVTVGSIGNREVREGIDTDIFKAKLLALGFSRVMIDRERAFGQ